MILELTNTVNKKTYQFNVTDKGTSQMYYVFDIMLESGMDDGSYKYVLSNSGNTLAQGCLQIGDFVPEGTKTYNNNPKTTYKVYDGE